jgi:hypothetical protein
VIRENTFESAVDFAKHYQETWGEATITERTDTCLLGDRVEVVAELAGVFDDILRFARGHICSLRPAERTALHGLPPRCRCILATGGSHPMPPD